MRPEPRVERDLDVEAQLRPSIGRVGGVATLRRAAGARSAASCAPKTGKTRPHSVCFEIGVIAAGRAPRAPSTHPRGRARRGLPRRHVPLAPAVRVPARRCGGGVLRERGIQLTGHAREATPAERAASA